MTIDAIDDYFDKIYIINLDNRIDRWENVTNELRKANINKYVRFSAIKPDLSKILHIHCRNFEKQTDRYVVGQMGCKMSHVAIAKDMEDNNLNRILILEDDIKIARDANDRFSFALDQIEKSEITWDMLYFGGLYQFGGYYVDGREWKQDQISPNIQKLKGAMETCAYAISKRMSNIILGYAMDSGKEIDIFYYWLHQNIKQLGYYGIVPPIIETSKTDSDING